MVRVLTSTKLTVALCVLLAAAGAAGSFLYQGNTAFGKQGSFNMFHSPLFLAPAGLLILNIVFCAGKRLSFLPLSVPRTWTFAGMHLGIVLLSAGMMLDGLFGFVGTKYYYRGLPESSYFDWRRNREAAFPFTVEVVGTEIRYHPLNLQVGVKDAAGNNVGIYTVREGVPFAVENTGLLVTPRRFDIETKTLLLDAVVDGRPTDGLRAGIRDPARAGDFRVVPEAYADPQPSEYIARVRFSLPARAPEEQEIRINRPGRFAGFSFCLVGVGADRYGNPFAGLQMTREPGEPVFWAGSLLFVAGLLGHFLLRGSRAEATPEPGGVEVGRTADPVSGAMAGLLILAVLGGTPGNAGAFGTVIDGERTWEGEVRVTEPVTVEKGGTLRIRPGTTVLLSGEDRDRDGCRDGSVQVFGTVLVEGEKGRPVRFTRLHAGSPWEEVFLDDAVAVVRHAVFEGANWGLHVHGGNVRVEHSTFTGNGGGARLKGTGTVFSRCTFRANEVGLRFRDGGPTVSGSTIEGNATGIFFREGTGGGRITGSRIANREWNLKLGDWAAGDLDASGNFWGGECGGTGFGVGDFRETKGAGRIVLLPALANPPEACGADFQEGR